MRLFLALIAFISTTTAPSQPFKTDPIRAHMRFLASDLLEGRGTATRGYRIAAEYVAAQFEIAGLEPGANGSWFQEVPFLATVPSAESSVTFTRDGAAPVMLRAFETFVTYGDPLNVEKVLDGPVVFAGYGITAPDQRYDDYAGVDAKGKIVAMFSGAPRTFPDAVRAHHSSGLNKVQNAAKHGAAGLIFLTTPAESARAPWPRVQRQTKLGSMYWTRADGTPHDVDPTLSSSVTLSLEATKMFLGSQAEAVFAGLGRPQPRASALRMRARVRIVSAHERVRSPNVIGVLRGSDPKLRDEYLVYSAHLDHLGITEPVGGDRINNGAFDNATGIASIIELARAFAALPQRPRRSILFLATTAEEKGLKGADYFVNNPTVPFESIVGNINVDMLLLMHATRDVIAFGAETNDLGDHARAAAREVGVELGADPTPEEVIFVRSDQYPFVRRGIPAIFVTVGRKAVDPNVDMDAEVRRWRVTRYHSPQDDLSQPIDYAASLKLIELDFRLGLAAANREARPRWKPGDFFGETFARNR